MQYIVIEGKGLSGSRNKTSPIKLRVNTYFSIYEKALNRFAFVDNILIFLYVFSYCVSVLPFTHAKHVYWGLIPSLLYRIDNSN